MVCLVGMTKNCERTLLILSLISKTNSYSNMIVMKDFQIGIKLMEW